MAAVLGGQQQMRCWTLSPPSSFIVFGICCPNQGAKGGLGVNNQFSSSVGIVDIVQRFGGSIEWLMNIIICSSFSCGTREPQSTVVKLFYRCYLTLSTLSMISAVTMAVRLPEQNVQKSLEEIPCTRLFFRPRML